MPRIGATKTNELTGHNTSELGAQYRNTLDEMKTFIEIAQKIQNIAKKSNFSYLEKLARKTKDDCKILFKKIEKESKQGDHVAVYPSQYPSIRNKFLNEAHNMTRRLYLVCKNMENTFKDVITIESNEDLNYQKTDLINNTLLNFKNSIHDIN